MAIAPITITPEREKVIDFSEPFLSIDVPIKRTRTSKQLSSTFSFLRPLSKEIW
ncbi:jg22209, partial [Pararge aegeria aegeria]